MPRKSSPSLPRTASNASTAPSTPRGHRLQFPLPDDFFPTVSLSLTQVQQYEAQVEELANKAVEACNEHESQVAGFGVEDKRWTEIAHDTDISIARRKQRGIIITRTFGNISGDYRRFVDFFSSETSEQLFAWNQFFYGCAVDAVVLCNMDLRKPDKQATLGIKWTCLQPSMLTRKRDECFLEYTVFRKDAHDRDVAVIVHLPIDIPECPPLPHEMKTKREKTTTVMVVRAADDLPNATQLFMLSQCNNRALAASTKYCRKLLKALKDVALSADAKRIATAIKTPGFLEQSRVGEPQALGDTIRPWVPTRTRNECSSCTRPFRAGHRRRHCYLCGDVFCTKCLVRRAGVRQEKNSFGGFHPASNQRTFRLMQALFCRVCVTRSREEDANELMQQQVEGARRSVASSKSSSVPRPSLTSHGSSTQPRESRCSSTASSLQNNAQAGQADAPRRSATWSDDDRTSWWSETESDTCSWKSGSSRFSTLSRNYSAAPTVRSSFSSEYSVLSRNSFVAIQALETPSEIDSEDVDVDVARRSSIMEVIDTKDMLPDSELQKQLRSQQPPGSATPTEDVDEDFFNEFHQTPRARYTSTPVAPTDLPPRSSSRRTRSTDQGKVSDSARSLDQCIAEQNELLKQVLSASRGFNAEPPARAKASSMSYNIYDEDHDDGVYEL
ncbi:hypothetical protein PHYBOEH_008184 [Phytophthora boehmeriae]|uniref:FYVE-type domain-containing protein n=1 Tax=Phytophthora boehmeriae TaxID=109152 RepID=A0A8T1X0K3_9STRA|nr:hypothetical protein PHYBOEH_008184 [Phytophthora boehmeriae]